MRLYNWHGFVVADELEVPADGAVQLQYRGGGRWLPACVYPNLTTCHRNCCDFRCPMVQELGCGYAVQKNF